MDTNTLTVGNLSAERGEKVQGYVKVLDTNMQIAVTLLNGKADGKTVVITSGIHGGEYPGIATAMRLAALLEPGMLNGRVIIAHPVNAAAFFGRREYVHPADGKNLNRVFPGKADGSATEQIAYTITNEMYRQADFVMDLHGGDIHEGLTPFVIYSMRGTPEVNQAAEEASRKMGFPYVLGSTSTGMTISTAAEMGIPCFVAELGECGVWSDDEVVMFKNGVLNVLNYLGVYKDEVRMPPGPVTKLAAYHSIAVEETGCWYPKVKPGDTVKTGDKIGEVRDVFSKVLHEYYAGWDGVLIVLFRSLAVNAGDPLYAIGGKEN